jgi:hypothetical protein
MPGWADQSEGYGGAMTIDDPNDLDRVDQEIHLNELKSQLGDEGLSFVSADCPPDVEAEFLEQVVHFERAPFTTHYDQLVQAGLDLPAPREMDDERLTATLWEMIRRLAGMRVFLERTDHLSDRELYTHLWMESLREEVPDLPFDEHSAWHIDILGGCSDEDLKLSLKYYADEEERRQWRTEWPQDEIPDHEDPPYDRDRRLPKPD